VAGIVDAFEEAGLRCFGPRREPAQLEGSKAFAKDFLARHGIPTAAYGVSPRPTPALEAYLREHGAPIVVKADGLAAGKGVIVAQHLERPKQRCATCSPATPSARRDTGWSSRSSCSARRPASSSW
jgi:phosphoribosylamine-glycine ligase